MIGLVLYGGLASGGSYLAPVGGWTYTYTGDGAVAGTGSAYDALDGTWSHDNGMDQWDGTGIGAGRPGGASALTSGGTHFLRLQDTGDPRDYGMGDPGSNRKITFGHSVTNDIGSVADTILDGVTISFRARLASDSPLDDLHPDGGAGLEPWPAGGDGYLIHDGGKGSFTVRQSSGSKIISFALATSPDGAELQGQQGLVMNKLNGTVPTGDVDLLGAEPGSVNILTLDPLAWHEFWITIEPDLSSTGTHLVNVYKDGSLTPDAFTVTAGNGSDYSDSYIAMAVGSTPQSGAVDIDFFAYKADIVVPGASDPIPEPAGLGLFGLAALAVRKKRK